MTLIAARIGCLTRLSSIYLWFLDQLLVLHNSLVCGGRNDPLDEEYDHKLISELDLLQNEIARGVYVLKSLVNKK